jgi:hypothetical protein
MSTPVEGGDGRIVRERIEHPFNEVDGLQVSERKAVEVKGALRVQALRPASP